MAPDIGAGSGALIESSAQVGRGRNQRPPTPLGALLCRCVALEEAQWQAALTGPKPREALGALGVPAEPGGERGKWPGMGGFTKFSEHGK